MLAVWIFVSVLLCYVFGAFVWSPPMRQLEKEYEDTERPFFK